jgi:hypothetical protein
MIALTASLFQWLNFPSDVTATLAIASGALIPAIAIRRGDRQQSKQAKMQEVVSGDFQRPFVYVLFIAAGLLILGELAIITISFTGVSGFQVNSAQLGSESQRSWTAALISLFLILVLAVAIGSFVAHRRFQYDLWCAIGAAAPLAIFPLLAYNNIIYLGIQGWLGRLVETALFLVPVLGVVLGVFRGRRTRPLFLANLLFKELSESDRTAVREIMAEPKAKGG